jgi:hypothetical protein
LYVMRSAAIRTLHHKLLSAIKSRWDKMLDSRQETI